MTSYRSGPLTEMERRGVDRRIRNEFEPRYIEVAETVLYELEREASDQAARELGLDPELVAPTLTDRVRNVATNIASEMFNRSHGHFRTQAFDELETPEGENTRINTFAKATIAGIAAKAVSTAFNEGREQVIEKILEVSVDSEVRATRTAVMDNGTCPSCAKLDGTTYVYGSDNYYRNKPPSQCDGYTKCRCAYVYEVKIKVDDV